MRTTEIDYQSHIVAGLRDRSHGAHDGHVLRRLLRITKTPEYQDIYAEVRRSALGSMDATLARRTDVAEIREEIRDEMEKAVPEAWRVLIHNLRQKRDLKAALEILDRDPQRQFAKGSQGPGSQRPQIGVGIQVGIDSRRRQLTLWRCLRGRPRFGT